MTQLDLFETLNKSKITLKEFMQAIDYQITDSSPFQWQCYGRSAVYFDSEAEDYTVNAVFDLENQTLCEMSAFDYSRKRAYRFFNGDCQTRYTSEAESRGVDPDEAWEGVKVTNLEVAKDMLEKTKAIVEGRDYDTRISVEIDLEDSELFSLMKLAHQQDVTFNQYVENLIQTQLDLYDQD